MNFKVTIHHVGDGNCSLTGRQSDGLNVSFEDGTIRETFLSWKAFRQLLGLKNGNGKPTEMKPAMATLVTAEKPK